MRMRGHRQHRRRAEAGVREPSGRVQADALAERQQQVSHDVFGAQRQGVVEEPRLLRLQQTRQRDGRLHVGPGVMRVGVVDAVGLCQGAQAVGGLPVRLRPLDALRAQGGGGAHHVDQVPPAVAVAPFAGVGVEQVAVQRVADELVVEAQVVVAGHASAGRREALVNLAQRLPFVHALGGALRRDARDQAGFRPRHDVRRQLHIGDERVIDGVQVAIRALAGELHDAVLRRRRAGGLQVVPVETLHRGYGTSGVASAAAQAGTTAGSMSNTAKPSV